MTCLELHPTAPIKGGRILDRGRRIWFRVRTVEPPERPSWLEWCRYIHDTQLSQDQRDRKMLLRIVND